MSIPNVNDYERIEDIEDVRTGDLVVSVSGNWYTVRADMTSAFKQLYCTIGGDAENGESPLFFFDSEKFDYALRKKQGKKQMRTFPDKPGLWKDKDGDIWVFAHQGNDEIVCVRASGEWMAEGACLDCDGFADFIYRRCTPFTPCKIVEES